MFPNKGKRSRGFIIDSVQSMKAFEELKAAQDRIKELEIVIEIQRKQLNGNLINTEGEKNVKVEKSKYKSMLEEEWYLRNSNLRMGQLNHLGDWYHNWKNNWIRPPIPPTDAERCEIITSFTKTEKSNQVLDKLCILAKSVFKCVYAGVTLMGSDTCYVTSLQTSVKELDTHVIPRSIALCNWEMAKGKTIVMPDLSLDPATKDNPVVSNLGIRFYAGTPLLTSDHKHIGSFCVLDSEPNFNFTIAQQELIEMFALAATQQLETSRANSALETMQRNFMSKIKHEICTPIHGITGLCRLLYNTKLDETQTEYVTDCLNQTQTLIHLTDDMLAFKEMQSGNPTIESTLFHPCQLLIECCKASLNDFPIDFLNSKFQIELFQPFQPSFECYGDQEKLRSILNKLINNAIKFSNHNLLSNVIVKVQIKDFLTQNERLESSSTGDLSGIALNDESNMISKGFSPFSIEIQVIDLGIGLNDLTKQKLFQPFFQVANNSNRQFNGTGLSLYLVKQMAELMKGSVWVDSEIGKGANFHCSVQLYTDQQLDLIKVRHDYKVELISVNPLERLIDNSSPYNGNSADDNNNQHNGDIAINSVNAHVLIVDDNRINLKVASRTLESKGYNCKVADCGVKALEMIAGNKFDFILMDLQMPQMDGFEVTREIRCRGYNNPIVALTASFIASDEEKSFESGMNGILHKPLNVEQLKAILKRQDQRN
jgi:signal transduction histidine kinase/CheY-like chemotaxis protein